MNLGTLRQKASNTLTVFVLMCAVVIVSLLYVVQKSEELGNNLVYAQGIYELE